MPKDENTPPDKDTTIYNFRKISSKDGQFSEALKYEILGLRNEMNQYMKDQLIVENYSLSAAAVCMSLTISLGLNGPHLKSEVALVVFLSILSNVILVFAYERIKKVRYRITRLGLYIYLQEKCYPDRMNWERFVNQFRGINMSAIERSYHAAMEEPDRRSRARKLNAIVEKIDRRPGCFTSSLYVRWKIIMGIAVAIGLIRVFYAFHDMIA